MGRGSGDYNPAVSTGVPSLRLEGGAIPAGSCRMTMTKCPDCDEQIDPSCNHCPECGAPTNPLETKGRREDAWSLEDLSRTEKILLANQFIGGLLFALGGIGAIATGTGDGSSIFQVVAMVGAGWFVVAYVVDWFVD